MQTIHPSRRGHQPLRALALAALLVVAPAALAGPPLLCHPFETAGARSLPWGDAGWNDARADYDVAGRLVHDTRALLAPDVPVLARMETLRRAAIYASRDGAALRALHASLEARTAAATDPAARSLALFDAGYLSETLQDIARLQAYDMPGIGRVDLPAIRAVLARGEGSARIAQALRLRGDDAQMRFAAALVASADQRPADYAAYARGARAGAGDDRLLALNLDRLAR